MESDACQASLQGREPTELHVVRACLCANRGERVRGSTIRNSETLNSGHLLHVRRPHPSAALPRCPAFKPQVCYSVL